MFSGTFLVGAMIGSVLGFGLSVLFTNIHWENVKALQFGRKDHDQHIDTPKWFDE
jgi:hypothetical protein